MTSLPMFLRKTGSGRVGSATKRDFPAACLPGGQPSGSFLVQPRHERLVPSWCYIFRTCLRKLQRTHSLVPGGGAPEWVYTMRRADIAAGQHARMLHHFVRIEGVRVVLPEAWFALEGDKNNGSPARSSASRKRRSLLSEPTVTE